MPGPPFLRGDRITLRTVEEEDFEYLHDNVNRPEVRRTLRSAEPQSIEDVRERQEQDGLVEFLVCDDGDPVGIVNLHRVDERRGNGTLGAWIEPDSQGEGYGTEAAELLIEYAFEERRLQKVAAHTIAINEPARAIFEDLGMTQEGHFRDEEFADGEYVDMFRYAILRDEWRSD